MLSMLLLRKILFYVFLIIYLVICPIVILYSFGYIYVPTPEEGIVKTGLIHLESLPPGAEVRLDQKLMPDHTPCTLSELVPGRYSVTVSLENYRHWFRQVTVEPGKAAVFDRILLIPERLRRSVLREQSFETIINIPGTRFLLLKAGQSAGGLTVYDWKNNSFKKLIFQGAPYAGETTEKIFTVKESPHVLVLTQAKEAIRYLWCDLREEHVVISEVTELFRDTIPDEIKWEGTYPRFLVAFHKGQLDRLDLDESKVDRNFAERIKGFGIYKGKVYILRDDSLIRIPLDTNGSDADIVERGRFLSGIFERDDTFRMDFLRTDKVFFIGKKQTLFANRLPYHFVEEGFVDYLPDDDFKMALIWTSKEIGLLNFEKRVLAGALFERGAEVDWFFHQGTDIRQVFFAHDTSHVIFSDGETVFLSEIDGKGKRPVKITEILRGSRLFYSEKKGSLYYLDPETRHFMLLEILPEEKYLERMFQEIEKTRRRQKA